MSGNLGVDMLIGTLKVEILGNIGICHEETSCGDTSYNCCSIYVGQKKVLGDREFGLVENCLIIKEEYRQRVEAKVLEIVETHPTIAAIRNGEAVTDLQLVALEGTVR